jgi:MFS family permease
MSRTRRSMSSPAASRISPSLTVYNKTRLFLVASLALATAGMASALRANTAADLQRVFLDPIDKVHSAEMIASVLGVPFLGFAITIAVSSPLLDAIGMALLLPLAGVLMPAGMLTMAFAGEIGSGAGVYHVLLVGAAVAGVGWGLVETVMNPLIASLYPTEKTAKLNAAHAWWPGGLVMGGLLGVAMSRAGFDWRVKLALVLIPGALLAISCMGVKFPPTERAAAGVRRPRCFASFASRCFSCCSVLCF